MSLMRKIRNNRNIIRIPMAILVVALAVGLVAAFTQWSVPGTVNNNQSVAAQNNTANSTVADLIDRVRGYDRAVQSDPNNLQALKDMANTQYDIGIEYSRLKNYQEAQRYWEQAIANYQKVLATEPDNINVLTDLATLAYYLGKNDIAKDNFEKAVALNPDFINARNNYGEFLLNSMNDPKGAIVQWQFILDNTNDPGQKTIMEQKIANAKALQQQNK